jgi:hypothetical protein
MTEMEWFARIAQAARQSAMIAWCDRQLGGEKDGLTDLVRYRA